MVDATQAGQAEEAPSPHPLDRLFDPATVRLRCAAVMASVEANLSSHFTIDRSALPATAARVAAVIRRRYPSLYVPPHSRWRHFDAGGVPRVAELAALLQGRSAADVARVHFDLVLPAVLLDAGAGAQWRYVEGQALAAQALPAARHGNDDLLAMLDAAARKPAGSSSDAPSPPPTALAPPPAGVADDPALHTFQRSEGLAVATFRAFLAGAFSADRSDPLRCDASTLQQLDATALRAMFQAGPSNPLAGLEGRALLMKDLGEVLAAEARRTKLPARPSLFFDRLTAGGTHTEVSLRSLLHDLLKTLAPIWREGSRVQGLPAGDCWQHRWAGAQCGGGPEGEATVDPTTGGWVPLHKLTQWLAYSLIEPLQWAGCTVTDLDCLTGLPEYRNGGLLLDMGVLVPRAPLPDIRRNKKPLKPGDEWVVEWRALTVALLDELAPLVRAELGLTAEQLPLAAVLEGGTWATGRELAAERRDGAPPVQIDSGGTVF